MRCPQLMQKLILQPDFESANVYSITVRFTSRIKSARLHDLSH